MLQLRNITRRFGATTAVDDISLSVKPGEIVGLVGENGAGKTTLMRIAAAELAPDSGSVTGGPVAIVHQHFALVPEFTIAENLALTGNRKFRFISRGALEREALQTITSTGIALQDVERRAAELSVGEKAKLELIKAISSDPQVLILDEPTSVLTPMESEELFGVIRQLASRGTAAVFISHKVSEVLAVSTRVVVMRRGRIVAESSAAGMTADDIAMAMVGKRVGGGELRPRREGTTGQAGLPVLHEGGVLVHSGEVVAIVGVTGNGQSELVSSLRRTTSASFIPEDRTRDALVAEMTIAENLALGARWNAAAAKRRAIDLIELYGIKASGPAQHAGELSGGNQQKVVLARELDRRPELIVAAEPTRGLDIEATHFVHEQLRRAVDEGSGLLLVTSDLDEAFALADVVQVIYRGRLSERLRPDAPVERIAQLMAGLP